MQLRLAIKPITTWIYQVEIPAISAFTVVPDFLLV